MQRGVVDVIRASAVMVDHDHASRELQSLWRNQRTHALGIHHDQHAGGTHDALRMLRGNQHRVERLVVANELQRVLDHVVLLAEHDIGA